MQGKGKVVKLLKLEGTAGYTGFTPAEAFFLLLFWFTLGHFWCSEVTSVTFSSQLNIFLNTKNPKNKANKSKKSKNSKNPQNPKYPRKSQTKIQKKCQKV